MTALLPRGDLVFTTDDLTELSDLVARTWTAAAGLDWSVPADGLDWTCLHTADHAVDCVYAPTFFLASRRTDGYPETGADLEAGEGATPELLVASLGIATRILVAVVHEADREGGVRSIIFRGPEPLVAEPPDFAPRAALELILHANDVCGGLGLAFEPPAPLCRRLREHTRPWPLWTLAWGAPPPATDDPWGDLLAGSGRRRSASNGE